MSRVEAGLTVKLKYDSLVGIGSISNEHYSTIPYILHLHNWHCFQIKKMFDKADKDGDGKLTKEEWYNVLNSSGCDTTMWALITF